ncbi:MAG: DNA polymerase III subunit alpha, partial [bacterium]|nr:DNA polymerase III subunit alpha [bacterium]
KFTHLHTHSHFSLLDGLSKIKDLVEHAKGLGMESLALTDHGSLYGAIEFYQRAKKVGIKPIIGCEMYICENRFDKNPSADNRNYFHLVLLAENNTGYQNLLKLVTAANLEGFYYKPRIDRELLRQHSEGLIALSACLGGEISRALLSDQYEKAKRMALEYQEIMGKGNYFLELQQHPNIEDQNLVNPRLIQLSQDTGIPLVATQDSHYLRKEDAHAHDVLLAVQTGNKVTDTNRLTLRNEDFSLLSPEDMAKKFSSTPEAIDNTQLIADRCNVEIVLGKTQLPLFALPDGHTANSFLAELCQKGLPIRYGDNIPASTLERLDYELGVIKETGFASYFLIVQDLVNWAKDRGIIVGPGRGSAAGSLVTYLLRITNIDPIKYDLIFERFLNPSRIEMPDIDLDFDDARRGEVFGYVREKYGADRFAQIITFGTMAARGSIRDAGRALGMPYDFCDKLAKLVPFNPNQGKKEGFLKQCVQDVSDLKQLYVTNNDAKAVLDAAMQLEGVARHSSTHACAVVITPEPLTNYLPLQKGTEDEDVITQYEMHAVADLGLLKMDFLGLANLTIINDTLRLIQENYGHKIDIDQLPLEDQKTFQLLQKAQTTGVFQLESAGMKRYLKELKPTSIEDIIAMVSLYRPGPIELIPDFIARKHGKKKVEYLYPSLEPILKNSYGVMVYQEQLLAAVRTLAGFTLAEADVLRKAVGKKIKKLLDEQEEKFRSGAKKMGTPDKIANEFWKLVEPFNRYAFNRSHAACYAMIAYQTAYLKANYPVEFMTAFLNSEAGDVERVAFLIEECQAMGIPVLPPDINESFQKFATIGNTNIRFGLTAVKNVGENVVKTIILERKHGGTFKNIEEFVTRVHSRDLNKKSLESLIKCGALDNFGERNALLVNSDQLLNYSREAQRNSSVGQISLFGGESNSIQLPSLRLLPAEPISMIEKLMWEKELIGLFVSGHPLKNYQPQLALETGMTAIKDVTVQQKGMIKVGGMVTKVQRIVTKAGKPMLFSWIEDLTSKIEIVVFPGVLEKYPLAWQENSVLVVKGKLNERDGLPKILCDEVKLLTATA